MKNKEWTLWALVISFVFGVALYWPLWCKIITILLSGAVIVQVCRRLLKAYGKED